MDCLVILAQAAESTPTQRGIIPIDLFWDKITAIGLVEALTFLAFGVVCLFYGWRIFKILVTICFGLLGLLVGVWANKALIGGDVIWLAIIFIAAFSFLSVPLMRWGVSILGAFAGGVLTGGAWLAIGLPEQYIWAGGLVGLIAGGMISFIIFKAAVILFTSLGGSGLIVVGIMAVMYQYLGAADKLEFLVFNHKWFLPAVLVIPLVAGVILQYRFIKGTKDWTV